MNASETRGIVGWISNLSNFSNITFIESFLDDEVRYYIEENYVVSVVNQIIII